MLPPDLIQKLQNDYVSLKYKDGIFTFLNIDEYTLTVIIKSFLEWAQFNKLVDQDNKLDLTTIRKW